MIRELFIAAAITGTAISLTPAAVADPGNYDGDVPGMNYYASLGAPCTSSDRYVFGVDASSTYICSLKSQWVPSKPLIGVRPFGGPCDGNPNAAQSPDGIPMACNGTGWVYNFNDIYYAKTY